MDASQPAEADARPRRAALHRRDDARRVPQVHREGRRARAALPARSGRRADRRGHDLDPARLAGALRGAPRRAHPATARSWPRPCSRIATSPTASCPTRRSTSSTNRPRSSAPRWTRCRRSSTRSRASVMQLEIEREALRKETDAASRERLAKLEKELAELKEQEAELRAQWEREKGAVTAIRDLRKQIEEAKVEIERAERAYDLNKVAELKYGRLVELEKKLAERKRTSAPREPRLHQGRGDRGGHRRSRRALDRHSGRALARRREAEAAAPRGPSASARHRSGGSRASGRGCRASRALRPQGSEPPDRLVHLPRSDRRRQNRARARARRVPLRRRAER